MRRAIAEKLPFALVLECDGEKKGCDFSHIMELTPPDINDAVYKTTLATHLWSGVHRRASLKMALMAMGAKIAPRSGIRLWLAQCLCLDQESAANSYWKMLFMASEASGRMPSPRRASTSVDKRERGRRSLQGWNTDPSNSLSSVVSADPHRRSSAITDSTNSVISTGESARASGSSSPRFHYAPRLARNRSSDVPKEVNYSPFDNSL